MFVNRETTDSLPTKSSYATMKRHSTNTRRGRQLIPDNLGAGGARFLQAPLNSPQGKQGKLSPVPVSPLQVSQRPQRLITSATIPAGMRPVWWGGVATGHGGLVWVLCVTQDRRTRIFRECGGGGTDCLLGAFIRIFQSQSAGTCIKCKTRRPQM